MASPLGTPQCTSAPQPSSTRPPSTNDQRKPSRAAAMAPHRGPITPPTVMADCMVATWRRTSPGSSDRPALMKANVEAAPISPTRSRQTKISGSVRAIAMAKNAGPLQELDEHERRLGIAAPADPSRQRRGDHGGQRRDARGSSRSSAGSRLVPAWTSAGCGRAGSRRRTTRRRCRRTCQRQHVFAAQRPKGAQPRGSGRETGDQSTPTRLPPPLGFRHRLVGAGDELLGDRDALRAARPRRGWP